MVSSRRTAATQLVTTLLLLWPTVGFTQQRTLYVTAEKVAVLAGAKPIGTAEFGQRFPIEGQNGKHFLISLDNAGKQQGWIPADKVLVEPVFNAEQWNRLTAARQQRTSAWATHEKGQSKTALASLQAALKVYQETLGGNHPGLTAVLDEIGSIQLAERDYSQAEASYKVAVSVAERSLGHAHAKAIYFRHALSKVYFESGHYERSLTLEQQNLASAEATIGPDHLDTAQIANDLAVVLVMLGKFAEAEPLYLRCLAIREAQLPKDDLAVADVLSSLGGYYGQVEKFGHAEKALKRALAIREAKQGSSHLEVANVLNNLAHHYSDIGRYTEAETHYRRSLAIRQAKLGEKHPEVAHSLNNLAVIYQRQGKHGEAELVHRRALAIREATLGEDHPQTGSSLHNLAVIYQQLGRLEDAERMYKRLIGIQEARLGKDHPITAATLGNLASLYSARGQKAEAGKLLERTLMIRKAALGEDHVDIANSLTDQAVLAQEQGRPLEEVEPLLKKALVIREAKLGPYHPNTAASLKNLGSLYTEMGRYGQAEAALKRSHKIYEVAMGKNDPATAESLASLMWLYAINDMPADGRVVADQARRAVRNYVTRLLPTLSPAQQMSYLQNNYGRALNRALSLGYWHSKTDLRIAESSALWLANGKGVQHEAQAMAAQLQSLEGEQAAALVKELRAIREAASQLKAQAPNSSPEKEGASELTRLEVRERELTGALRALGGNSGRDVGWTELTAIRAGLPTNGVLIDFAQLLLTDFNTQATEHVHYVAWITPKLGPVRVIDLGDAEAINAAVRELHREIAGATKRFRDVGELDAEAAFVKQAGDLQQRLLAPLLEVDEVRAAKSWVISPDGALWLIPWVALPLEDNQYLVERYVVRLVNAGRDTAWPGRKGDPLRTAPPLIIADPDFDLGRTKAAQITREIIRGAPEVEQSRSLLPQSLPLGRITRLPDTAKEAEFIAGPIRELTQTEPRIHSGAEALEAVVKATRQPRLLTLSTHGFFLPDQEIQLTNPAPHPLSDAPAVVTRQGTLYEEPLLRCGLLLAACNDQPPVGHTRPGEDGVLTGLEVVTLDLRGCELVVLSACETGLGEIRSGEGVAGLRQAFQLAGAQSVLASLWQVPDNATALLMASFFRELASGKDRPHSLAVAQRSLIKRRRDRQGAAHPFFWAAFALTGRDLTTQGDLSSAELYNERGKRWMSMKVDDLALADFDAAKKLSPSFAPPIHNRGMILKSRNQIDEAIAAYNTSIELDSAQPTFFRNRSVIHRERRDHAAALADLNQAVELDTAVDSLLDRAYLHRVMNKPELARADLEQALEQSPTSARAWSEKGIQMVLANKADEGIKAFEKALALDPRLFSALHNRGRAYRDRNDLKKALQDFELAVWVSPESALALEDLARAKDRQGDYPGALAAWQQLATQRPDSHIPRWEMGARLFLLGRGGEAIDHIEASIRLNPKHDAYSFRAALRLQKGDVDGAEQDATKALEMGKPYAFAYLQLGKVRIAQKRAAEAVEVLSKALELDPKSITAYEARADAYRLAGDEAAAVADVTRIAELKQSNK